MVLTEQLPGSSSKQDPQLQWRDLAWVGGWQLEIYQCCFGDAFVAIKSTKSNSFSNRDFYSHEVAKLYAGRKATEACALRPKPWMTLHHVRFTPSKSSQPRPVPKQRHKTLYFLLTLVLRDESVWLIEKQSEDEDFEVIYERCFRTAWDWNIFCTPSAGLQTRIGIMGHPSMQQSGKHNVEVAIYDIYLLLLIQRFFYSS